MTLKKKKPRAHIIGIRLSDAELAKANALATRAALPVSTWIRSMLAAILIAGCSAPVSTTPVNYEKAANQDQAVAFVWGDIFGEDSPPPPIEWIAGAPCGPEGNIAVEVDGVCAAGLYYFGDNRISLVTPVVPAGWVVGDAAVLPIASSALVHELCHAALQHDHGDDDGNHDEYPDSWSVAGSAHDELRARGW